VFATVTLKLETARSFDTSGNFVTDYTASRISERFVIVSDFVYILEEKKGHDIELKRNSVSLVRKRNIPTERAASRRSKCQLLRIKGVAWSAQQIPTAVKLDVLDPEPLHFHSNITSVILTRLCGPRSRPTTSQKIW
jgi:hypothetical protein